MKEASDGGLDRAAQGRSGGGGYSDGPVWNAFGLTYAAYAVFRRRALQSMPVEWQQKLVDLINEMHEALPPEAVEGDFVVQIRKGNRFAKDELSDYRHTGAFRKQGG